MTRRKSKKNSHKGSRQTVSYRFTKHAKKRMLCRDIPNCDIRTAMTYGTKLNRTGIVFFFVDENDLPEIMQEVLDDLIGTTVLFDPDTKEVITVYRNPDGLDGIKSKPEYAIP